MILRSSVEQLYNAIILSNLFLSYTFIRSCLMIRTRALTIVWLWIHEKKQEFQSQYFSILAREGTQFFMGHYQSLFLQIVHQSSGILPCLSFWGPSLDETTLPAELWLSTSNCKYLTTVTSNCNTLCSQALPNQQKFKLVSTRVIGDNARKKILSRKSHATLFSIRFMEDASN